MQRQVLSGELVDWIAKTGMANALTPDEMSRYVAVGRFDVAMQRRLGCADFEVATSVAVLDKMMFDHGLPASRLKSLLEMVHDPLAIYRSATHPTSSVVIVSTQNLGSAPVLIPIWLNKQSRPGKQPIHWISSAYAKNDPHILRTWDTQGHKLWP